MGGHEENGKQVRKEESSIAEELIETSLLNELIVEEHTPENRSEK